MEHNQQNKAYEEIKHQEKLIAIILRSNYTSDNIVFFTPSSFSQQLGFLPHKKGGIVKAHLHCKVNREITLTQEVLFIRKGRIRVNFYADDKEYLTSRELNTGDTILLCSGGHGFNMLEDTEMIEVKQGPHLGDGDKERFEGIE
ncbi:MAG: hypothetical protein QME40_06415 [bacterium]|nr:hypothetical protein [bacterium]